MKRALKLSLAAGGLVATLSMGVLAAADGGHQNDATTAAQAKVSLVEAVATAEKHVGGKSTRAEYERSGMNGAWTYDVEVVTPSKVFDVKVDALTGTVLSAVEDRIDTESDEDDHDHND